MVNTKIRAAIGLISKRSLSTNPRRLLAEALTPIAIPQPKSLPFFGTIPSLILAGGASKLHLYTHRRHKELGPIYRETLGNVEAIFISDPEYMRTVFAQEGKTPVHLLPEAWHLYNKLFGSTRGLFFMNGEEWLYNRRIMNGFLLKGDLKYIDEACDHVGKKVLNSLGKRNLEEVLYKWSLDTITAVLLGARVYEDFSFDGKIEELSKIIHMIFEATAKLQFVPATLAAKMNIKAWKNFVDCVDRALEGATDLVQELLENYPNNEGLLQLMTKQNMPKSDIVKIIVDLVLAAGDTTAYTMEWMLYNLAKHPAIQHQLSLHQNPQQSKNFIRETLRLYPVAPFLTRLIPSEINVGPHRIPPNTLILLSLYTAGRNEKHFKNPNDFNPERWIGKSNLMGQASLPFSMGSRACIGRKIAEKQLSSTLENVVERFAVELEEDGVEMVLKMVAVPSKPIRLKFVERKL